ncbi:DUF6931 family protein [Sphingomonas sp. Leaf343]|uniref:DUF6931 family protein n=1 Tax=Sphingomonas sp. Leaf343 TaxID=1736345 RepID=UPI000AEB90D2|nr:hypothetical protein [Sphingomonas sp. Leaf343]
MPAPAPTVVPLRFQRLELQEHGGLSAAGLEALATTTGPEALLTTLMAMPDQADAAAALALMLPRRQSVWWACLAVRLIPGIGERAAERVALETAETWVQTTSDEAAERAFTAAEFCAVSAPARWAAMAAHWSGPSIAPRGLQPVPPAAHLTGIATRTAMLFTVHDPALRGRLAFADLVAIGVALMHGDVGRKAQAAVLDRLAGG